MQQFLKKQDYLLSEVTLANECYSTLITDSQKYHAETTQINE